MHLYPSFAHFCFVGSNTELTGNRQIGHRTCVQMYYVHVQGMLLKPHKNIGITHILIRKCYIHYMLFFLFVFLVWVFCFVLGFFGLIVIVGIILENWSAC